MNGSPFLSRVWEVEGRRGGLETQGVEREGLVQLGASPHLVLRSMAQLLKRLAC
jgi:hypothetical protein